MPSISVQNIGTSVLRMLLIPTGAACAQNRLRFVDEQERQRAIPGPFPALGEKIAHLPLRFTHPHVQNFRAFDVQEEFRMIHAGLRP